MPTPYATEVDDAGALCRPAAASYTAGREVPVYYQSERVTIYHGDCLSIVRALDTEAVDAVISDPPYGMGWNTDSTRFSPGRTALTRGAGRDDFGDVREDARPFDPAPWLDFPRVVLWGANHYAECLPVGTSLIWIKKHDHLFGSFLSDAEIGWMKGGHGVYCHRQPFPPPSRMAETNTARTVHPTQKPTNLMAWTMTRAKVPDDGLVLDPYAGSGTTAIAALRTGRRCILIEVEERYCETAALRISRAESQQDLFPAV